MPVSEDYNDEPWCDRDLNNYIIRSREPFNAEAKVDGLIDSYVTPVNKHFRRNHGPIPNLDKESWNVTIEVDTNELHISKTLNLNDLNQLPQFEVIAVLECAGNRRDGLKAIKEVNGVTWGAGTASNSQWGGCRLRDILVSIGVPKDLCSKFYEQVRHVEFAAYGEATDDKHYASSIPLEWVMNPQNTVLVATRMNGQALIRDHGFPARIVAPGIIGARWVKWLRSIRVQDRESDSYYQQLDYKILPPMATGDNCDKFWPQFPALQELSIQSAICRPAPGEKLQIGRPYVVRGYALSGAGRAVDRVEVSLDCGRTWELAKLVSMQGPNSNGKHEWSARHWAWVLWSFPIASVPSRCSIACRAWDAGGNTQPDAAVWNYRGVMNNAVFRIEPPTTVGGGKL
ncbi:hypothetical protein IWW36_002437 [Coemansia brasiliensis]|uniref:Sulfite oxidase n=1 Tax=Coemansia brasiliensis TaxID=2650707 RepID=A0A9W8I9M6_9FUNG|nr:hypothetical protein IWW36_002437 [Coemansia brasiliensis]